MTNPSAPELSIEDFKQMGEKDQLLILYMMLRVTKFQVEIIKIRQENFLGLSKNA